MLNTCTATKLELHLTPAFAEQHCGLFVRVSLKSILSILFRLVGTFQAYLCIDQYLSTLYKVRSRKQLTRRGHRFQTYLERRALVARKFEFEDR